jgi:hypothetical protein
MYVSSGTLLAEGYNENDIESSEPDTLGLNPR